jgi:integrase
MRERTGSIDPVDGRFRVRVTLNSGRRRVLGRFDTRAEAQLELDEALKLLGRRVLGSSLKDHVDGWLVAREAGEYRDTRSERNRFANHIEGDEIADLDVRSVRRRDVLDWLVRMQKKGLSRQTIANVYGVLRGSLGDALNRGKIREDICSGVKIAKSPRTTEPWTFLDPDEQRGLIASVPGVERLLVQFAIGSGLRAGELCALRLADVDLRTQPGRVTVRYGRPPMKPTKNGKIRVVPLVPMAREALDRWLEVLKAYAPENPNGLVFPRVRGGFRYHAHVIPYDVWTSALTSSGLTRRVRWHDLRHTCASSLVSGWWGRRWSLEEVREVLGHSSITLTQRYAHLAGTAVEAAAKEMPAIGTQSVRVDVARGARSSEKISCAPGRTRISDQRFRKSSQKADLLEKNASSDRLRTLCEGYLEATLARNADRRERFRRELSAHVFGDARSTLEFCETFLVASVPKRRRRGAS